MSKAPSRGAVMVDRLPRSAQNGSAIAVWAPAPSAILAQLTDLSTSTTRVQNGSADADLEKMRLGAESATR